MQPTPTKVAYWMDAESDYSPNLQTRYAESEKAEMLELVWRLQRDGYKVTVYRMTAVDPEDLE